MSSDSKSWQFLFLSKFKVTAFVCPLEPNKVSRTSVCDSSVCSLNSDVLTVILYVTMLAKRKS